MDALSLHMLRDAASSGLYTYTMTGLLGTAGGEGTTNELLSIVDTLKPAAVRTDASILAIVHQRLDRRTRQAQN